MNEIPCNPASIVFTNEDGTVTRYSAADWRHKQVMDRLDSIEDKLDRLLGVPRAIDYAKYSEEMWRQLNSAKTPQPAPKNF